MKTVILERNSLGVDIDVSRFADFGPVTEYPVTSYEDAAERIGDAQCVLVNKIPMGEKILESCPNVKLILESATGIDNIDLDYCSRRGITVTNVKSYSTDSVAQHTFALLFYLLESLSYYDEYVKGGTYASQPRFSHFDKAFFELKGKTWGIVGLGEIGRQVASVASAFGCRVIYYSASGRKYDVPYEAADFKTLLEQSDIVSIHAPLNEYTKHLFTMDAFRQMKPTAYLLNVGRGPIIKDEDLAAALNEGLIAGAGLDVIGKEPIEKDNPLSNIKDSTKLIITPHMAWASTEARERLVSEMYENAKAFLNGEKRNVVS